MLLLRSSSSSSRRRSSSSRSSRARLQAPGVLVLLHGGVGVKGVVGGEEVGGGMLTFRTKLVQLLASLPETAFI